jgi:hypothetical protein
MLCIPMADLYIHVYVCTYVVFAILQRMTYLHFHSQDDDDDNNNNLINNTKYTEGKVSNKSNVME